MIVEIDLLPKSQCRKKKKNEAVRHRSAFVLLEKKTYCLFIYWNIIHTELDYTYRHNSSQFNANPVYSTSLCFLNTSDLYFVYPSESVTFVLKKLWSH